GTGVEELSYSLKLSNASITSFKQIYEDNVTHDQALTKKYNEIKFIFKKIEFISPGAMAEDTQN
ncbi:MAG TPA: hypothetical protein VLJ68_02130, partial [Chitinophagaceae bacterium]|nr:hypothetical protein [Chitinophagaceae bacterium]